MSAPIMQNSHSNKRRIGLYGGSFNPPHIGHLIVADAVRDYFQLDEVWWIPSDTPPHKVHEDLASSADRLELTRRAVQGNEAFSVCPVEVERGGVSYTIDTVTELQEAHPSTDFALIIGSDSLAGFPDWHRPDDIVQRVPLLVYKRPGSESPAIPPRFAERTSFVDAPLIDISGTDIRQRIRNGHSVRYLVPTAVREYLDAHQIYRPPAPVSLP